MGRYELSLGGIKESLNIGYLHNVLSIVDSPITYVKRFKDSLFYKKRNKGSFTITKNKGRFELNGEISKNLTNKLEEYKIKLKEIN